MTSGEREWHRPTASPSAFIGFTWSLNWRVVEAKRP